jgi:hypothetical protein
MICVQTKHKDCKVHNQENDVNPPMVGTPFESCSHALSQIVQIEKFRGCSYLNTVRISLKKDLHYK